VEPDAVRAGALVEHLRANHPGAEVAVASPGEVSTVLEDATGLVNASPVGMFTHPGVPLPVSALRPDLWVADIVYRPTRTQLIEAALALGCRVMEGGYMAVGQAADTFELVTGLAADRERMRAHFRALVAAEADA
jgi:shikimate dehydrogenase